MSTKLTKEQLQTLGMESMSTMQRDEFLLKIGKSVFDGAIVKLLHSLSDEQIHSLDYAIETNDSFESVMQYLQMTYPDFATYLKDEQEEFTDSLFKQT
ncbi:MAG: hypothetical protein ACI92I_000749 [Acidimicrobiales bacterium]|jgi:hypothetical protein